ncbi:MAG TPA: hypothetical protein VFQ43_12575, partial [Nitrososphaera sp.]|nr:hypothetical protein [Nitrososphaera sp.]
MTLFLILLAVCAFGGFLVTSLIWVLFWAVGVFEVPLSVTKLFRAAVTKNYQNNRPNGTIFIVEFKSQAGMGGPGTFKGTEGSPYFRLYPSNSASGYRSSWI